MMLCATTETRTYRGVKWSHLRKLRFLFVSVLLPIHGSGIHRADQSSGGRSAPTGASGPER